MKSQLKNSEYCLKPADIRKIIYAARNYRDRSLLKTLALTAMRRVELASLDVRDADFDQMVVHIRNGKGGKSRIIPLSEELASDLKHLIGSRTTGPLFLSQRNGQLTVRQVNWIVSEAGKRSGVKNPNPKYDNITCHLFRHSFAREWKRRNGSIESLAKILGHTSVKTTLDEYGTEGLEDVKINFQKIVQELG